MRDPKPWTHEPSALVAECTVFRVMSTEARSPHSDSWHTFYQIDADDWVNVVPVTPDDQIVMVRQFRHGSRSTTLEVPGGIIDPGESPAQAAARELLEETGYQGAPPEPLGSVNPNPAIFNNRCHSFVVRDARPVAKITNTETEETIVELVPATRLASLLKEGAIDHALVISALQFYALER